MSTTVDQRVVEMRFDNAQFEDNVKTSMSTLEKLKQSLNLNGAAKGLDGISKAANEVNLTGISTAVGTLETKFSALEVMGITALTNITNSAVNAGKKVVSALTIDPIKTGFQEYETQINAVQTILANTKSKGSTIDDVNAALDELNKYADLTIYNFTEMTRNIGTFTAAGVDLETSVNAIQGIANLAAVSGSTSQQASTAMYQLSQALAAGTVKLMDWNSVVNAGMGGEVFQNALKKTSELLGTGAEAAIKAKGSFRESLSTGWLTSQVLTETLKKFTTSGANEYVAEYIGQSPEVVESALKNAKAKYGEAEAIKYASKELAQNYDRNEDEIRQALEMAQTATDAATKVKTFTQLWDVMKEAAQSGWAQTWRLIIGDFEEAKNLLTPLADFFTNVIGKMSDARNKLLEGALNNPFADMVKKVEKVTDATKKVTKAMEDYGKVVDKVLGGEYGNGQARWDKLAKEGYDWAKVQNMVNEKLGSSVRHTEQLTNANKDLNETKATTIEQLVKMSDAQLKEIGFTKDEIEALRYLQEQSEKTGLSLKEIMEDSDKLSGRALLINSFKNAGKGLVTVFTAMAQAWKKVFPPMTSMQLYNIIAAIHKFSTGLVGSEETADKFYRTFRGVFSLLKIAKTLVAGPLSIAFKVLKGILGAFDIDILDLTANIGDVIYRFSEWLDSVTDFTAIFEAMKPYILEARDAVKSFSDSIKNSKYVAEAIEWIRDALLGLKDVDLSEVGHNIIEGLKKGLSEGAIGSVVELIASIAKKLIDSFCEVLGIHSPSKVFMAIGGFIMAGLLLGLNLAIPEVREFFMKLADTVKNTFSNIDWKNVFAAGISVALLGIIKKLTGTLDKFAAPLAGLGELLENVGKSLLNFSKAAKSFAFKFRAEGIKDIAIALAVLVGVVIALAYFVHKVKDPVAIGAAVGLVIALAAILTALAFAVSKLSQASIELSKNGLKIGSLATTLIGISLGILLLAKAVTAMGALKPEEVAQGFNSLYKLIASMLGFVAVYGLLVNTMKASNISGLGSMMIKMAVAMLLMVGVVKIINMLKAEEIVNGAAFVSGFIIFTWLLAAITNNASFNADELGKMLIKISIAIGLMAMVVKLIGRLEYSEMLKGAAFAAGFLVFVKGLILVTKVGSDYEMAKVSGLILAMSFSMLLMVGVMKLISMLKPEELAKGGAAILAFTGVIALMCAIVKMVGSDAPKIASTILAMSVAIGILAGAAILLSLIDLGGLAKGITAIGMLSVFMSMMIVVTDLATNCKSELIVLTVAIGVMAAAVAALSMIKTEKLAGAVGALALLMGMFALMTKAMSSGAGNGKAVASLLGLTLVVAMLAGIVAILDKLGIEGSVQTAVSISILMLSMAATLKIIGGMNKFAGKAILSMLTLTLVVAGLAAILGAMSYLNVEGSIQSAIAISTLLLAMSESLVILNKTGPMAASGVMYMLPLTLVVAGLAAILGAMSYLNVEGSIKSAIAISTLLLAMSAALVVLNHTGPMAASGVMYMLPLTLVVAGLAGILGVMSYFNVEGSMQTAIAISTLLLAMSAALVVLNFVGPMAANGVLYMLPLTLVVAGLAAILGAMSYLNVEGSIPTAIALSTLLLAMSKALILLNFVGPTAIAGVGALAVMTLIVAGLAGVLYLIQDLPVGTTMVNVLALSALLIAMSVVCGIISVIPAAAALQGALGLASVIAVITGVLVALGAFSKIPGFNELIASGGETLAIVGKAIGKFVGSIVGGLAEGITSGLPGIGTNLSKFIENVTPFINGIKMVDGKVLAGVGILTASVIMLTAADLLSGIYTFINGGSSFAELGTQLSMFMVNAAAFIIGAKMLDEGTVNSAKILADTVLVLTASNLISGITSFLTGGNSFEKFGTELSAFGRAIVGFSNTVSQNGGINVSAVNAAANAGKMMAEFQKTLPGTGGIVQWFIGEKDMGTFASQLVAFGNAIVQFSRKVSENGGVNETAITAAASAGKIMVEFQKTLPNTGGIVQWFTGEKNMATFGSQLVSFGRAIVGFSNTVSAEGAINEAAITAAANAGKIMTEMQSTIIPTGGVVSFFVGQKNIAKFGTQIKAFGEAIVDFSEEVQGLDSSAITSAAVAGKIMANVQKAIPEEKWFDGKMSLTKFGKKIKGFGKQMAEFSDEVSGIDTGAVNTAVTNAQRLVYLIKSMAGIDTSGIKTFKSAISELGKINYDSFVEAFNSSVTKMTSIGTSMAVSIANGIRSGQTKVVAEANDLVNALSQAFNAKKTSLDSFGSSMMDGIVRGINKRRAAAVNETVKMVSEMLNAIRGKGTAFENAGSVIMNRFIAGISKNKSKVSTIMKSMVSSGVASIRSYYTNFYSAGAFCVDGFCLGITANTFKAEAKAAAMAEAALEAARKALREKSPSKAFYEVGDYAGQGFVNALDDSSGSAYDSGYMMADYARKGLSKAVAKIQSLMNTDMDIRPTISPVVDLSNVESGTAAIRGMLGQTVGIGASTSLAGMNAVDAIMRRNSQNESNADVVAAIDKLRKDVRNLEGTNNTINGLTYGDDSGISEAIGTIVRAARIERRM